MKPSCETCKHWRPIIAGPPDGGECRINPPEATYLPRQPAGWQLQSYWPVTHKGQDCGRWDLTLAVGNVVGRA